MILKVFSVFDSAVGAYMQPFFMRSTGEAIRSFQDACSGDGKPFSRNSSDYTLFLLGEYDDAGAEFHCGPPQRIVNALEMQVKTAE